MDRLLIWKIVRCSVPLAYGLDSRSSLFIQVVWLVNIDIPSTCMRGAISMTIAHIMKDVSRHLVAVGEMIGNKGYFRFMEAKTFIHKINVGFTFQAIK